MRRWKWIALALAVLVLGVTAYVVGSGERLPSDVRGGLVFVSDREGPASLYWRRLPRDRERRLTHTSEAVADPAISPDGTEVAFTMGGRIGLVAVATGEVRMLTLGVEWMDAAPAWRPDGKGLVVASRRVAGAGSGLHVLDLPVSGEGERHPLTQSRAIDDQSPTVSRDGTYVVFVREDNLWRVSLADGHTSRLTGGFKKSRAPRFHPSGRILCLWTEGKVQGIDVLDADGRNRETLWQGAIYYRHLAPSPDGRYLAATFSYDLGFHPADAFRTRQTEEVRLLDARGNPLSRLEYSWRYDNHSPDWAG
jgi:Tol biopolymer transport system component